MMCVTRSGVMRPAVWGLLLAHGREGTGTRFFTRHHQHYKSWLPWEVTELILITASAPTFQRGTTTSEAGFHCAAAAGLTRTSCPPSESSVIR